MKKITRKSKLLLIGVLLSFSIKFCEAYSLSGITSLALCRMISIFDFKFKFKGRIEHQDFVLAYSSVNSYLAMVHENIVRHNDFIAILDFNNPQNSISMLTAFKEGKPTCSRWLIFYSYNHMSSYFDINIAWQHLHELSLSIYLWNTKSRGVEFLGNHNTAITDLAFSLDGEFLASGDYGGVVKIWDTSTKELYKSLPSKGKKINRLVFSPVKNYLATLAGSNTVFIWNIATGNEAFAVEGNNVKGIHFSSNGQLLFIEYFMHNEIKVVDLQVLKEKTIFFQSINDLQELSCFAITHDSQQIVFLLNSNKALLASLFSQGQNIYLSSGDSVIITSAAFSSDKKLLALGMENGAVFIFDIQDSKKSIVFRTYKSNSITSLSFSPEGKYLLIISGNNKLEILRLEEVS